jgi:hypothetical protein
VKLIGVAPRWPLRGAAARKSVAARGVPICGERLDLPAEWVEDLADRPVHVALASGLGKHERLLAVPATYGVSRSSARFQLSATLSPSLVHLLSARAR